MPADAPRHLRLVAPAPPTEEPAPEVAPSDLDGAFRAYGRYVGYIALRILGRPDEVEDLVQEVFLDAHQRLGTLRDPGALKGFLATLTVRKAVRALKRRKVRRFFGFDDAFDYAQLADAAASPHERALVAEVYRVLDELPAEQRTAWVLRHIEGEKVERVAELCGCSLATVKRRIAAAQATLYGELSDG
ncbi:MAG TPA: sigma-70 family RNA polymerase sigma factor [Sandaracinaceae bacterium]